MGEKKRKRGRKVLRKTERERKAGDGARRQKYKERKRKKAGENWLFFHPVSSFPTVGLPHPVLRPPAAGVERVPNISDLRSFERAATRFVHVFENLLFTHYETPHLCTWQGRVYTESKGIEPKHKNVKYI